MKNKKVMAMPVSCFISILVILVIGIIIGSFCDYDINVALANKTNIGALFATYGSYFSYCLYPAAGACLFVGLKQKGNAHLGKVLLVASCFLAVYYSNSYNGSKVRELFKYTAGQSETILSVLSWLFWVVLYIWVPFVFIKLVEDKDPDYLIAVGASILVAGVLADNVNLWLKQVASRPRYKYLLTLDNPLSEYRQWWQMIPNFAGSNDNFKSWPSGNMTIASMMFSLPMLTNTFKNKSSKKNTLAFIFACIFVALYGYNRIHMTNHFLSDVCFGTLFCYLIYAGISSAFMNGKKSV